jgi:hypothetical protein
MTAVLSQARKRFPEFDPKPFERTLQAFYREPWKLIVGSDGSRSLYDLTSDPQEERDLAPLQRDVVTSLVGDLTSLLATTRKPSHPATAIEPDPETRARLEALGYVEERRP